MPKILVIDDEKSIRKTLREILEYEKFKVEEAADGVEGIAFIQKEKFDVVLCDVKMPKMDGMEVLDKIMEISPDTPVIMISGHGNVETAVDAVKKGALNFISKPPDLGKLLATVRNAIDRTEIADKKTPSITTSLPKKKTAAVKGFDMIGESKAIMQIKEMIEKVAPTDARVLITGENGSGKELVARWLHAKSARVDGPMVEVNCAAIPSELIESELFGHEKGAFTSAIAQRKGKFEQAEGGTLFMDEIGDMSLSAQAKVLRALQESKIARVGGDKEIKVNVRVVAATNKDLRKEIEKGNFREDLYHRLSVILIHVPSLNDRRDDIPLLADHFVKLICEEYNMPVKSFSKEAIKELQKINWTGNIREFRNVVERLIILCDKTITDKDVVAFAKPVKQ